MFFIGEKKAKLYSVMIKELLLSNFDYMYSIF